MKVNNSPKIKGQYRQGDVFIERTDLRPTGEPEQKDKITLANGEATGHSHVLEAPGALWWSRDSVAIFANAAQVTHQEHGVIPLNPGGHKTTRQRQYSPEGIRNVAD